jgi:hypothetical protein
VANRSTQHCCWSHQAVAAAAAAAQVNNSHAYKNKKYKE